MSVPGPPANVEESRRLAGPVIELDTTMPVDVARLAERIRALAG